jgi:hypothetical protein
MLFLTAETRVVMGKGQCGFVRVLIQHLCQPATLFLSQQSLSLHRDLEGIGRLTVAERKVAIDDHGGWLFGQSHQIGHRFAQIGGDR